MSAIAPRDRFTSADRHGPLRLEERLAFGVRLLGAGRIDDVITGVEPSHGIERIGLLKGSNRLLPAPARRWAFSGHLPTLSAHVPRLHNVSTTGVDSS